MSRDYFLGGYPPTPPPIHTHSEIHRQPGSNMRLYRINRDSRKEGGRTSDIPITTGSIYAALEPYFALSLSIVVHAISLHLHDNKGAARTEPRLGYQVVFYNFQEYPPSVISRADISITNRPHASLGLTIPKLICFRLQYK